MLTEILHRIASQPRVYDAIQALAGSGQVNRRLAVRLAELPRPARVLDVGGGTGLSSELWPAGVTYVCLDIDPVKLRGFRRKHPRGIALAADATRLPLASRSFDLVVCKAVFHHLSDPLLPMVLRESARVLRPGAHLVFVDPLWAPARRRGRLLWRYDRGSFPRSEANLRQAVSAQFAITRWDAFAIHHQYVLGVGSTTPPG
jgi:ubiquinone/menaquinone biosynthesis C-methylase UbiE